MLAVTGFGSQIVTELHALLPEDEQVIRIEGKPPVAERYLLCAGIIRAKTLREQTEAEIAESLNVNLIRPMRLCDEILERDHKARICVVGSESGFAWSHDGVYAASKAALHRYVETKQLLPNQQLVCIAPSIIEDCGMTTRRDDKERLAGRERLHPKRRFLKAVEVARLIYFLLYVDLGYTTGTVIRMHGGAN